MKKTLFVLTLVMVAAMFLVAAAPGFQALARLTVNNKTGDTAYLVLDGEVDDVPVHYYLTVPTGTTTFTLERTEYDVQYSMCGFFNDPATLDMENTNVRINLHCDLIIEQETDKIIFGEPTMEKVYSAAALDREDAELSPADWRWQY